MSFGITATGFVLKTIGDIRSEIDDFIRNNAPNGAELILSDDTLLGNMNGAHSQQLAQLWELGQDMYNAKDPDTATGWALDVLASLTGTSRNPWTKTLVTAQVTLNPNKALPAGSIANLAGRPDDRFVSLTTVPADPSGGTFDVVFEAEEAGTIEVAAGQLTEITVAVSGWTAVTNAADGIPGSQPEEDPDFRDKRDRELSSSGSTNLDAIIAGVSAVDTVIDVTGTENEKDIVQDGEPPHSVSIIVRGGVDTNIAEAIFLEKAAGITTNGTTSVDIQDSQNQTKTIKFTFGSVVTIYVDTVVVQNSEWNGAASIANIKAEVVAYINGLGIGDDVIYDQVKAAILREPGVLKITSCFTGIAPSPAGTTDITIAASEYAETDVTKVGATT